MPRAAWLFRCQQFVFLFCSRIFVGVYGRWPLFGRLRSSIGVIRRQDQFLVIERSDRLGFGFPGGITMPWESDERSLEREIKEETGLAVQSARLLFRYRDDHKLPSAISVFAVEATGQPRPSWEGRVCWLRLAELAPRIFPSHAAALQRLGEGKTTAGPKS